MEYLCPAQKSQCNRCKKTGRFSKVGKFKTVNRTRGEDESHNITEQWTKKDQIQSVNWIDFYKTIFLVEEQPKEFKFDTGSPITKIQPKFNPKEVHKIIKYFVDVHKNPIEFKGEATMEVKTEKSKETLPILITGSKHTASVGSRLAE